MRTDTISSFKSAIKILSLSDIDSVFYVFQLVISICLAARKYAGSSALAPLWKIGQVACAAGYGNRQNLPMFLRLKIEPRKSLVLIFAGEIRVNRQKPTFHLISLPQAIVKFSSVLPICFHSHIF